LRRKPGENPAQERCCKDGAVFQEHSIVQSLESNFWEGEKFALRAKSEYIRKNEVLSASDSRETVVDVMRQFDGMACVNNTQNRGCTDLVSDLYSFSIANSNFYIPTQIQIPAASPTRQEFVFSVQFIKNPCQREIDFFRISLYKSKEICYNKQVIWSF
jgi:hypothetical protein